MSVTVKLVPRALDVGGGVTLSATRSGRVTTTCPDEDATQLLVSSVSTTWLVSSAHASTK